MATFITNPPDAAELRITRLREALARHGWPYVPFAATGEADLDQLEAMLAEADVRLEPPTVDDDGAWHVAFADDAQRWTATAYSRANAIMEAAIAALGDLPTRVGPRMHRRLGDADARAQRRG